MTLAEAKAQIHAQLSQQAINTLSESLAAAMVEIEDLKAKLPASETVAPVATEAS